jgi:RNA polymerase sigma factor (sigma-70 family)
MDESDRSLGRFPSLEELYRLHVGRAEALARALTHDPFLAQDIAHEAFVRVTGRLGHIRSPDAFGSYLRRTVVNMCSHHFRSQALERERDQRVRPPSEMRPEDVEVRDELWEAIAQLPYRQRASVVLRFYEDLTEEQTGEILRCSDRAVNSLVSRAMVSLRQQIRSER